jgi:hypothetical protein
MKDSPLYNIGRNLLVFFQFVAFTAIGMVAISYLMDPNGLNLLIQLSTQ